MTAHSQRRFQLRDLGAFGRLGLTAVLGVLVIGMITSNVHIYLHHQNRDESPGVSMLDLVGAYHGVNVPSPLRAALADGHPEGLDPATRTALEEWLGEDPNQVSVNYDNLDLGEFAPAELIAADCLQCHARGSAEFAEPPLETWDDVRRVAFSTEINPPPISILVASTHAHALAMGTMVIALALMLVFSRWPAMLVSALVGGMGVGLLGDIGGWWVARPYEWGVFLIIVGGALFQICTGLTLLLVLIELWGPRRSE